MRIHHIGIIVRNIQKALSTYLKLGYKQKSDIVIDDNQHIAVVFLLSEDNLYIISAMKWILIKIYSTGLSH